jgi:hypothetical protein
MKTGAPLVVLAVVFAATIVPACGSSETNPEQPIAGSGGAAQDGGGSAGVGATGGAGGHAGQDGGKAGDSSVAGSGASAGAGGSAGAAGKAGAGGSAGGGCLASEAGHCTGGVDDDCDTAIDCDDTDCAADPACPAGTFATLYPWEPITSVRILPSTTVPATPGNSISISACHDEFEAASFVMTATKDLSELTLHVPTLSSSQGNTIPASAIDVRIVKVWYQAAAADIWLDHLEYILAPELLLKDDSLVKVDYGAKTNQLKSTVNGAEQYINISDPSAVFPPNAQVFDAASLQPFSLKANENKQIWITVHVPSATPAADYSGNITLTSASETPVRMKFTVTVLPFDLAPAPVEYSIYYRGMVYGTPRPSSAPEGGVSSEWKTHDQYSLELQDMKDHGVPYPTLYQEADYELDAALLLRSQGGLPKDHIYALNGIRAYGTSDPTAMASLVQRFQTEQTAVQSHGFGKLFVYATDEASGGALTAERQCMTALKNAGAGIFIAGNSGAGALVGDIVDIGVISGALNPSQSTQWHGNGHKVFSYANPQVGIENPEIYRNHYGVALWNAGYDGAMDYAYQHGYGDIWNDYDTVNDHYRDHVFAYPTTNGVIDTVQWEGWREGVDDTRYLATLISKMGNDTLARSIVVDALASGESMASMRKKLIAQILSH